jgi:predicted amidophosphoribosyltransferase
MVRVCKEKCGEFYHDPILFRNKYVDHNYCSTCVRWFLKSQYNILCPCCHVPLRHRAKYSGAREKEVLVHDKRRL